MGGQKESFHALFRPPIYALSAKKERLIAGYNWKLYKIGHFPVPKTPTFKMRLGANLSSENEFYLHENEK